MANEFDPSMSATEQAAHWWALLHSEDATGVDHRLFGEWMCRSPERIEAYLQTARLMHALASPTVLWPDTPAQDLIRDARTALSGGAIAANANVIRHPRVVASGKPTRQLQNASVPKEAKLGARAQLRWLWSGAAILVVILAVTWSLLRGAQEFSTRLGEQRYILLEDGSRVTLNTNSSIKVKLDRHRRLIRLAKGEALFQVSHDMDRPFEVQVGNAVLRAVGTQFDVIRRLNGTTVTVVEGRVAVVPERTRLSKPLEGKAAIPAAVGKAATSSSPTVPAPPGALVLGASERVVITPSGLDQLEHVPDLAAAIFWAQRRLVFDHRPLGEVAEEFNRYNTTRIIVEGVALQRQEISGVFQSDDPTSFLSFLADVPDIQILETPDGNRVVTARH